MLKRAVEKGTSGQALNISKLHEVIYKGLLGNAFSADYEVLASLVLNSDDFRRFRELAQSKEETSRSLQRFVFRHMPDLHEAMTGAVLLKVFDADVHNPQSPKGYADPRRAIGSSGTLLRDGKNFRKTRRIYNGQYRDRGFEVFIIEGRNDDGQTIHFRGRTAQGRLVRATDFEVEVIASDAQDDQGSPNRVVVRSSRWAMRPAIRRSDGSYEHDLVKVFDEEEVDTELIARAGGVNKYAAQEFQRRFRAEIDEEVAKFEEKEREQAAELKRRLEEEARSAQDPKDQTDSLTNGKPPIEVGRN
jgi:hypothetical protein